MKRNKIQEVLKIDGVDLETLLKKKKKQTNWRTQCGLIEKMNATSLKIERHVRLPRMVLMAFMWGLGIIWRE